MTNKEKYDVLIGLLEMGEQQVAVLEGMLNGDLPEERRTSLLKSCNALIERNRELLACKAKMEEAGIIE